MKIQDKEGIPPWQQRVVFERAQLEGARTLREHGMAPGAELHLLLRLHAGPARDVKSASGRFFRHRREVIDAGQGFYRCDPATGADEALAVELRGGAVLTLATRCRARIGPLREHVLRATHRRLVDYARGKVAFARREFEVGLKPFSVEELKALLIRAHDALELACRHW